ncbi:hypothetical protein LCGC14_2039570 [marine sediment metagenome]|uniref:Uncharacterized protein n=1 Tax=marine sediment metagenome TaxID=412755 RepID=A0A0F9ES60_9ZZZZ
MKIKNGDILKVKPTDSLVVVISQIKPHGENNEAWLNNYWKTKYNLKLPQDFKTVFVNFPSHSKAYEYPIYKKCIKRPLRQKKYLKRFLTLGKHNKLTLFLRKLQQAPSEFLRGEHERRMWEDF